MRKILGIDPGLSGGLSIIDEHFNLVACYPMPTVIGSDGKRKVDPVAAFDLLAQYDIDLAVVEKVGARPGQGVTSMFNFGDAFGVIRAVAALVAKEVKFTRPQEWRGCQGLTGLSKEQIAEVAYEVFKADAIYGRTTKGGARAIKDGISDSLMIAKSGARLLE